jgi:hypothetical protein
VNPDGFGWPFTYAAVDKKIRVAAAYGDYIVRLLNETIAGCEGQDIRNWKSGEQ